MLPGEEYEALCTAVTARGGSPLTTPDQYLLAHHLPNWYPFLKEFTPETVVISLHDDLIARLRELGWERYFVKDYVKSLKTSTGAIIQHPEQITDLVAEMQKYRGTIEGGLCVRRVEPYRSDTERRFFVISNKAFGSDRNIAIPEVVQACAARIERVDSTGRCNIMSVSSIWDNKNNGKTRAIRCKKGGTLAPVEGGSVAQ